MTLTGDILEKFMGLTNAVSTVVNLVNAVTDDNKATPAPVEVMDNRPVVVKSTGDQSPSQPPININLTVNVYKNQSDSDLPKISKSEDGLLLDLK